MGFFKRISAVILAAGMLASCASGNTGETKTESTARFLTSEDGYTLRVERGSGRVEVTSPEELCGVEFLFTDTESYLISGEMKIPLSEDAAAPFRDLLVMAYPEDHSNSGEKQFSTGGADFEVVYQDRVATSVSAMRGGVTRRVTLTEG